MANLNRTDIAILALVAAEPRSGYDIRRAVQEQLSHFWNESVGNIYPRLRRLHEHQLLTKRTIAQTDRPDRHEYAITDRGRAALSRWFEDEIQVQPPRNELLLKLFFGRLTSPSVLVQQVAAYRAQRAATKAQLEGVRQMLEAEAAGQPHLRYWLITLRAGIVAAEAAVKWADETIVDLESDEAG